MLVFEHMGGFELRVKVYNMFGCENNYPRMSTPNLIEREAGSTCSCLYLMVIPGFELEFLRILRLRHPLVNSSPDWVRLPWATRQRYNLK
ncbi:uncharacterized protein LOC141716723 isoform X4 [Apium graveolens]|uniref:uncharacterized protein LOC141716723 isoform X4 n=1 Tax=Apium graveolens TaxID=4045 RepID=UPI003D79EF64